VEGDVSEASEPSPGTLYVVSTPIGHMGDFSSRAISILRGVSAVLAEDTRHSRHLLERYEIATPMLAHHEHNEARATPGIVDRLRAGDSFALISDAGTPLLSDPGARLVRAAIDADLRVVPVPGASALLSALVASGIDAERFTFYGFLPRTGADRREVLDAIVGSRLTSVIYESPARLVDTVHDLVERGAGDRQAAVAREMTKHFEEIKRGTLSALGAYYGEAPPKGEIVVVIAGAVPTGPSEALVRERVMALRASGMSARDAAGLVAAELGVSRRVAYRFAQGAEQSGGGRADA
jgi:16S rRNA (cytidine1402-2'-O)-methyltransferase